MQGYKPIGKLEPSTLVYTVGAVAADISGIDTDAIAIHKELIEEYPQYSRNEIGVVVPSSVEPLRNQEKTIVQYALNNPDRSWGILLMHDRILFHTTDYKGFDDYAKRFSSILSIIQEKTGLKYHKGMAFKHIDNIFPIDEDKKLNAAINSQFHTPNFSQSMDTKFSRHEYIYNTGGRRVIFKLYNYDEGNAPSIPQEVFANYFGLKGRPGIEQEKRAFVLADFEVNNIKENASAERFEIKKMIEELDELHQIGSIAYREVITPDELKERGCKNGD